MKENKTQNKEKQNLEQGFTLLELLVVVIIIGLLASIAIPQYRKTVAKAELAQIITVTKAIKQAQDRFYLVNNAFANNLNKLDITIDNSDTICSTTTNNMYCHNKNFILWLSLHNGNYDYNYLECASKTDNEKSALFYACKDFMQKNFTGSYYNLCTTCSTCVLLDQKPCYKWTTNHPTF